MTGAKVSPRRRDGGGFLRWVELAEADADVSGYPFTLPVVAGLRAAGQLELDPAATFLVGDNGTGKSTLIEAIAVAAGFNPEGGSANFRFSTRATEKRRSGLLAAVVAKVHISLVRDPASCLERNGVQRAA